MTQREKQILGLIQDNPLISQQQMADLLGIKRSSVAVHILNLTKKGKIKGKGYILDDEDDVVVIGGANIDITGFPNKTLVGGDSNPGSIKNSLGGVGRNIAENLSLLGTRTKLITVVGNDAYGSQIIEESSQIGIDCSLIKKVSGNRTSTYLCVLNSEGDTHMAVNDMKIMDSLTVHDLQKSVKVLKNAKAIVIDTNLKQEVIQYICENFNQRLYVDTVSFAKADKINEYISYFHAVKLNLKESELLYGKKIKSKKAIKECITHFINSGVKKVIISLGESGVAFGAKGNYQEFKIKTDKILNTTGAGDAFLAGFIACDLNNKAMLESIQFASVVSLLTIKNKDSSHHDLSVELVRNKMKELGI